MKQHIKEMVLSLVNGDEAAAKAALADDLKLRLEAYMNSGNVHQFAGADVKNLIYTDEFKKIQDTDPGFAKKLETAWKGDAAHYKKSEGKKFDPLFPLMLKKTSVEKMSKLIKVDDEMAKILANLSALHAHSFPTAGQKAFTDKSQWADVKLAREHFEDADEYNALMEACKEAEEEEEVEENEEDSEENEESCKKAKGEASEEEETEEENEEDCKKSEEEESCEEDEESEDDESKK